MLVMRFIKHLTTWLLLLAVLMVSGLVSAKVASGSQNLSGRLNQAESGFNSLIRQAKIDFNYDTASGSSVVTKRGKTDFIVSRDGAVVPNSPSAARQSLDSAGFGGKKISNPSGTETGTIHNIPGMKMDVRVMNGGPKHPSRVVTTRQGTRQPVNPANGSNFGNVPKAEQRARSHIPFQ